MDFFNIEMGSELMATKRNDVPASVLSVGIRGIYLQGLTKAILRRHNNVPCEVQNKPNPFKK